MTKIEFQQLFEQQYSALCHYAFAIVQDHDDAEDIVQAVFVDFWSKISQREIDGPLENYLVRAVKFKCIDFHRSTAIKRKYESEAIHNQPIDEPEPSDNEELTNMINMAIHQLPEKTQEVFLLSKREGLSYKEIADKLHISPKTVENQMGRAFKHLREKLKNYKDLLVFLIFFWFE